MSKRRQEKQGGKGEASDDEIEEVETGFQAADPSVLATRKMKGLPQRDVTMGSRPATPSMPTPPATGRFAGFAGFRPSSTAEPPSNGGLIPLGGFKPNGSAPFSKPLIADSSMAAPPPLTPQATEPLEEDEADLLTNYRGLNQTFMQIVSDQLKRDPFVDISAVLIRYQKCRMSVKGASQSTFTKFETPASWETARQNKGPKKTSPPKPTKPANPIFDFGAPPVPPNGTFTFGASTSSSSGDVWKTKSAASLGPDAKFVFNPIGPQTSSNPFNSSNDKADKAPSNPFAVPSTPAGPTLTFGSGTGAPSTSTSAKGGFSFGSGFGAPTAPSLPTPPGEKTGSVGNAVGFAFGSSKEEKKSDPPTAQLTKPSGFSSFGAFGASGASKENIPLSNALTMPSSTSTEVSFPTPRPALLPSSKALTPISTPLLGSSREETPASESAITEGTNGENATDDDEIYEGEEDETTIYSLRTKVSKFVTTVEKSEWKAMGVGLIKLKQHNETGIRRILHRDTASKRVVLNCRLFKDLTASMRTPTMVFMTLVEDSKPVQYLCRAGKPEDAAELRRQIEEQVTLLDS